MVHVPPATSPNSLWPLQRKDGPLHPPKQSKQSRVPQYPTQGTACVAAPFPVAVVRQAALSACDIAVVRRRNCGALRLRLRMRLLPARCVLLRFAVAAGLLSCALAQRVNVKISDSAHQEARSNEIDW